MSELLNIVLLSSLVVHVFLIGISLWRVWRGENVIDRLIGVELMATLTLAVLVLLGLIQGRTIYMDVALGLAALGFIGTMALAKYTADEQVF